MLHTNVVPGISELAVRFAVSPSHITELDGVIVIVGAPIVIVITHVSTSRNT